MPTTKKKIVKKRVIRDNPISLLTNEQYRQLIAGILDPHEQISPENHEGLKQLAVELVLLLARHYNRDTMDPLKIWDRLGSAISTAHAKTPAGEPWLFINICLEHIDAKRGRLLSDSSLQKILDVFEDESPEFAIALIHYLKSRDYVVLTQAKMAWEQEKSSSKKGVKK